VRVSQFAKAISETVKEGDVVVDLGTGTGILAFLAVKAGAKRVHAIERNDIIHLAQEVANANGLGDRIVFHKADAHTLRLPERADVVISETIGHVALAERFLENMLYARRNFLKKGGAIIPRSVSINFAPVECAKAYKRILFWKTPICGFDFSAAADRASRQVYMHSFEGRDLLASATNLATLDLRTIKDDNLSAELRFSATRNGELHGFCAWFVAHLSENAFIDTSPITRTTHWEQAYFPVQWPQTVKKHNSISFKVTPVP